LNAWVELGILCSNGIHVDDLKSQDVEISLDGFGEQLQVPNGVLKEKENLLCIFGRIKQAAISIEEIEGKIYTCFMAAGSPVVHSLSSLFFGLRRRWCSMAGVKDRESKALGTGSICSCP